jgi:Hsp20/alpha crystallin family
VLCITPQERVQLRHFTTKARGYRPFAGNKGWSSWRHTRQLLPGESLDTNRLEADYDQGVLTLRIPVAEAAKPRRVEITQSAGGQRSIVEGQATHKS